MMVNLGTKWSVWSHRNVGFPKLKLMILCFHQKLDDEVLVGCTLTSQEGLLGARMQTMQCLISFFGCPRGRHGWI